MLLVLKLFWGAFKKFDHEYRDRRSENFFIGGSLYQSFFIVLLYYLFVKLLGPQLMEKRKPLQLKYSILIYNAMQVLFNSYVVIKSVYLITWHYPQKPIFCATPHKDNSAESEAELFLCYCFVLLKVLDFMDTVFMVLRKRERQITFLHVYHHMVMALATTIHFRYLPGGHIIPMGVFNCWVHAVMYFYYFISALNPELKKSIWWKKHITQIQIIQFLFLTVFYALPLVVKKCDYPPMASLFVMLQAIIMLFMFSDFYRKTYLTNKIL